MSKKNHRWESGSWKYKHEAKMTVCIFTMIQTACTKLKCLFGKINYQSQRKQKRNKKWKQPTIIEKKYWC